jgi:hypothetical protein
LPRHYVPIIQKTLEDDLLIQRGRAKDLGELSPIQKLSELAFQKAQNKVKAEDARERRKKTESSQMQ